MVVAAPLQFAGLLSWNFEWVARLACMPAAPGRYRLTFQGCTLETRMRHQTISAVLLLSLLLLLLLLPLPLALLPPHCDPPRHERLLRQLPFCRTDGTV